MLFDEVDEAVEGLFGGDVVFFADVEVDLVGGAAYVAEVGELKKHQSNFSFF